MGSFEIFDREEIDKIKEIEKRTQRYRGSVYAIEYGEKVKIGSTTKPYERIRTVVRDIEGYANTKTGRVLVSKLHTNYRENEYFLHGKFSDFRIRNTESFNIKLEDVMNVFSNEQLDFKDESKKFDNDILSLLPRIRQMYGKTDQEEIKKENNDLKKVAKIMKEYRMWAKAMEIPYGEAMEIMTKFFHEIGIPFPEEMIYNAEKEADKS